MLFLVNPPWFFSSVSFGVVLDFITSFHSNRCRNGMILFLFLGQELLNPESLVRRDGKEGGQPHTP